MNRLVKTIVAMSLVVTACSGDGYSAPSDTEIKNSALTIAEIFGSDFSSVQALGQMERTCAVAASSEDGAALEKWAIGQYGEQIESFTVVADEIKRIDFCEDSHAREVLEETFNTGS